MVLSALPTCLLFQAASPEYVFGAFLTAAALSALYTLPSRNGRIYTLFTALSAPFWLLAFVTECVSFYFFSKNARFFPDYPIAIVLIFALCALLIGIRGRRGIERLSVLIGLTMLLLAFISLFTAGPAGEGQRSLYLFFLPSINRCRLLHCCRKSAPGRCTDRHTDLFCRVSRTVFFTKQPFAFRNSRNYRSGIQSGRNCSCGIKDDKTSPMGSLITIFAFLSACVGALLIRTRLFPRK